MNKHPDFEPRLGLVNIICILVNAFSPTLAPEKKWHAQGILSLRI